MARKGNQKRTREERERWRRNQERMERLLEKALAELQITREELHRRVGFPPPPREA
jgi:translation initiation factor 2 alpha subunit (eIF-2alpha)